MWYFNNQWKSSFDTLATFDFEIGFCGVAILDAYYYRKSMFGFAILGFGVEYRWRSI